MQKRERVHVLFLGKGVDDYDPSHFVPEDGIQEYEEPGSCGSGNKSNRKADVAIQGEELDFGNDAHCEGKSKTGKLQGVGRVIAEKCEPSASPLLI